MENDLFEYAAREAIEALPEPIKKQLHDVTIVIEDRPKRARGKGLLLGLYEGVPLTEWHRDYSGKPPDKITLYRESIMEVAEQVEDLPRIVRETVWHEVGHYFGLDHKRIGAMEKRWRERH